MKNDIKTLDIRENITRKRLKIIDQVDMGSISRLKGFELFKLYQILEAKLTHQNQSNTVSLKINKNLHYILKEAYQILKHDILIPLALKKLFLNLPITNDAQNFILDDGRN